MKLLTIFFCAVSIASALPVEEEWKIFKEKHGKQYRSLFEEKRRFQIFKDNLNQIEEHNKKFENGEVSYKLACNKFTDLTDEEFEATLNLDSVDVGLSDTFVDIDESGVPEEIDWKERGAVTKIKNQGSCGGCWAFAANAALESHYYIHTGITISLSEQYLIDCSSRNHGCNGGAAIAALQYIRDYGIVEEDSYPYAGFQRQCTANGTLFKDMGYGFVKRDENSMKVAVAKIGPLAVSMDARLLKQYGGGVFDNPNCSNTSTNHVILIVGYGTTSNGLEYWEVKNSWGTYWGEDGFFKMSRNKGGQCGIATGVVYPIV